MQQILTFNAIMSRFEVQHQCDAWAQQNSNGAKKLLSIDGVKFTRGFFNSYEEAVQFLNTTFGSYQQTAVRYRVIDNNVISKTDRLRMESLERRITEYEEKVASNSHYAGIKSKTITCKNCESSLNTSYCGKTWFNQCPVCGAELRPPSAIEKAKSYYDTLVELKATYEKEKLRMQHKLLKNSPVFWAVAAEMDV